MALNTAAASACLLSGLLLQGCGSDANITPAPSSTCTQATYVVAPTVLETPCPKSCGCEGGKAVQKSIDVGVDIFMKDGNVAQMTLKGSDKVLSGETWSMSSAEAYGKSSFTVKLAPSKGNGDTRCVVLAKETLLVDSSLESCWTCSLHNTTKTEAWPLILTSVSTLSPCPYDAVIA
eukprot:TRINITY_DN26930_c0_g1_i1.p1 TRINITY_DN26930_c0_g1~~TRINITY_DN26930_c0_g1_i1.p1  ORF type:complete len:197 (-),score=42.33 TRINITY_DN26930_c0_g1_i1:120-650(-)